MWVCVCVLERRTCFAADFPVGFSARVLDALLADHVESATLKVAVSLLKVCAPTHHLGAHGRGVHAAAAALCS